jgi:hypothetical protein
MRMVVSLDGPHEVVERPIPPCGPETSIPRDDFRCGPPLMELLRFGIRWIRSGRLIPQMSIWLAPTYRTTLDVVQSGPAKQP